MIGLGGLTQIMFTPDEKQVVTLQEDKIQVFLQLSVWLWVMIVYFGTIIIISSCQHIIH